MIFFIYPQLIVLLFDPPLNCQQHVTIFNDQHFHVFFYKKYKFYKHASTSFCYEQERKIYATDVFFIITNIITHLALLAPCNLKLRIWRIIYLYIFCIQFGPFKRHSEKHDWQYNPTSHANHESVSFTPSCQ